MISFLMIGQSNMAGRGFPCEVEPIVNDRVFVMRNGIFRKMYVPVNPDRSFSGICLAESFADAYQRRHACDVGLIPCADGGTRIEEWREGSLLFDHACYMAELAARSSEIGGVLWHQGESDCKKERYPFYYERLLSMLEALRARLGMPNVPIVLGGLGDHLADCELSPDYKNYVYVNEAIRRVAKGMPRCAFADAAGLSSNPDRLHFSAAALRELGLRYFKAYEEIISDVN